MGAAPPRAGRPWGRRLRPAAAALIRMKRRREIVRVIKDSKKKVQASIQGDFVRVSGKDRDTLQDVIQLLRQTDFGIDMQFTNYRTN